MMDIDRFDDVYSVGDTIVGGIVLTRKFNPDGFLLWERTYRPASPVKATWVAADPNGGAYVVGYSWTGSNQSATGYFVLRYDADGNLTWSDVSDGIGVAVGAVADRAGNAYVTGGLFVAGIFTTGIVKYSPAGRLWVCPVVSPNGNLFPGTPSPTGLYLSDDDGSVAASGTSGYNYYVLSCDQSGLKRFQDFRDHSVYAAGVAIDSQGELYFGNGLVGGAGHADHEVLRHGRRAVDQRLRPGGLHLPPRARLAGQRDRDRPRLRRLLCELDHDEGLPGRRPRVVGDLRRAHREQ